MGLRTALSVRYAQVRVTCCCNYYNTLEQILFNSAILIGPAMRAEVQWMYMAM